MVAVPQERLAPADSSPEVPRQQARGVEPSAGKRAVAVVVDAMELLRPQSDLVRMLAGFDVIDVLVAAEAGDDPDDEDDDDLPGEERDELAERVAALELPGMTLCRLGLRTPFAPTAEHDLVAAMSELIGFDPEPGVYCLAPQCADPSGAVVHRAAQRIAQVYGLPLMRYRCMELSVVGAGSSA